VERSNPDISIHRQCQLLGLPRSSYYYRPTGESDLNLVLMRLLDEQYTRTPFYGSPKMTLWLKSQGYDINHKRVERLMRVMGLQAVYPKPNTSKPCPSHKIYPYLLRDVRIDHVDQVWSADITYIRLSRGFLYLVAVMDWFSRYVLSWRLSNTLESSFCVEALEESLAGKQPEIFNTDQGTQFTSADFTGVLQDRQIAISMDGRGRYLDNIFVERLWRSVKYEEVYLHDYQTPAEAYLGLKRYFEFYNTERFHQSLNGKTPYEIYNLKPESEYKVQKENGLKLRNTTLF
jgi:putative transposase